MQLSPGTGVIYEDPLFINSDTFNFDLLNNSPCINSGNPEFIINNDLYSNIGASYYPINNDCLTNGDINNDSTINILDVVQIVNLIVGEISDLACDADINNDNEIDVLDIISIINFIIN